MASFTVQFASSDNTTDLTCDGYAQEGTMLTFYQYGNDCDTIDAWSQRVASFKVVDVVSVVRRIELTPLEEIPVLVAC